ncbi:MAG: RadC family protein [Clostridia bacterium]|nr:RadC family protein [Clostridia bacterium]
MEKVGSHSGHRRRLIEKFKQSGLTEVEIVELLLFFVFKRRNTNDLAHRLLGKFGTLKNLFSADVESLMQVEDVGEQVAVFLRALGACNEVAYAQRAETHTIVGETYNPEAFLQYVKGKYEDLTEEVLDFYLLEKHGNIRFRRRFQGTKGCVSVEPFDFTKLILDHAPSGIIAVHNHPSGIGNPSVKDDEMTRMCQLICSFHNVLFCDHVIVAKSGVYSYYRSGKMKDICRQYSIRKAGVSSREERQYLDEASLDYPKVFSKNLDNFTIEKVGDSFVGVLKD